MRVPADPARRGLATILLVTLITVVGACADEQRTGTNFCRRLGESLPEIGQSMATQGEILEQVSRYERLLEVAPLAIEDDFATLVDLLRRASQVDPDDAGQLQELADASYRANRASKNVAAWTIDTCAVDITTGLTVAPPRVPVTTVPATSTTVGDVAPDPGATSVPAG
jgi:hypothetical protein